MFMADPRKASWKPTRPVTVHLSSVHTGSVIWYEEYWHHKKWSMTT